MTIRWPKDYTKALTRDQIRLILRIYFTDRAIRRKQGYKRCTYGLYHRLAAEFGVKFKLIKDITEHRGKNRKRFRDINIEKERENARLNRRSRTRYRQAIADEGDEQIGTGPPRLRHHGR